MTEIDLKTLRVNTHRSPSAASRRGARAAPSGRRCGSGTGSSQSPAATPPTARSTAIGRSSTTPAGLRIVDTRTWRSRALDPQVSSVQLAGGLLLASGSTYAYDGKASTSTFTGLIAYSRAGHELYRVFDGLPIGRVAAIGGSGYATVGGATYKNRTVAFDLATGQIGAARRPAALGAAARPRRGLTPAARDAAPCPRRRSRRSPGSPAGGGASTRTSASRTGRRPAAGGRRGRARRRAPAARRAASGTRTRRARGRAREPAPARPRSAPRRGSRSRRRRAWSSSAASVARKLARISSGSWNATAAGST